MAVYNFGSINIDHVYQVSHFVRPGETMTSNAYQQVLGGKGANQSIALGKANCQVKHVGAIANSDEFLLKPLNDACVDTQFVNLCDIPTGHAIIQVNNEAENAIVLFPGANHQLSQLHIDTALADANAGDWALLQNETNNINMIIEHAQKRGLLVAFNPAPMDVAIVKPLIEKIDLLIVNEVEAMDLCNANNVATAQQVLQQDYPQLQIILTLGARGVRYIHHDNVIEVAAFKVNAVDTTAAGDTFIGYCLAALETGNFKDENSIREVLTQACAASALCVTRHGASSAIPTLAQVEKFLKEEEYDT